jgi:hypothetical protein
MAIITLAIFIMTVPFVVDLPEQNIDLELYKDLA